MLENIRILPNPAQLNTLVAEQIGLRLSNAGDFHLCLTGGSTPRRLYELLAADHHIPWDRVHLYWGDERFVPPDDEASNQRMVRQTLTSRIAIPPGNLHPMAILGAPAEAATAYESVLRKHLPGGIFDLLLLGLGSDAHVASLFPNAAALNEHQRWVVPSQAPAPPLQRLTLTLPILNRSRRIFFLVSGEQKAGAVSRVLQGREEVMQCPGIGIRPQQGAVKWWIDEAAASLLNC